MSVRKENVKWVDGLRGVASILVVITHLARAFDDGLFKPTMAPGQQPRYLQLPIIRVFFQGRIGVAIFSLVTGYVCSWKPIRQFRDDNQDAAFRGIAKSAFRRLPRLVLPTSLITCIIWVLCELGAFEVALKSSSWWLNLSPGMKPDMAVSLKSLSWALIATWANGNNPYDPNQWTLPPLLKGAMLVYVMLFATSYCKSRYRMMAALGLYAYYYISDDAFFGMQFFFGVFLSELSQATSTSHYKWPARILTPFLIFTGLVLASYPDSEQQWQHWSSRMTGWAGWMFPYNSDTPRFFTGVGLDCIVLGIHLSPCLKSVLSNRYFLFLGKHSFAVYLIHGTLIRTVLTWMCYGVELPKDVVRVGYTEPGPPLKMCGRVRWYACLPIWFGLLYTCAMAWTRWVDPWCARLTEKFVSYVFEEPMGEKRGLGEDEKPLLPH